MHPKSADEFLSKINEMIDGSGLSPLEKATLLAATANRILSELPNLSRPRRSLATTIKWLDRILQDLD